MNEETEALLPHAVARQLLRNLCALPGVATTFARLSWSTSTRSQF